MSQFILKKMIKQVRGIILPILCLLVMANKCPQNTIWETSLPDEMKDLNNKNLIKLSYRTTPNDKFKVALIADSQRDPHSLGALVSLINNRADADEIAFIIILGDLTDMGRMAEYKQVFTAINESKIPYFGVIGNHDAISYGKDIYEEMFGAYNFDIKYKWAKFVVYNNNGREFGKSVPDYNFIYDMSYLGDLENGDETFNHYILAAHAYFLERPTDTVQQKTDYSEEVRQFKQDSVNWGYFHGIFGHHHEFDFKVEDGATYFKVDKVANGKLHFGLMTISEENIKYQQCDPECIDLN